MDRHGSNLTDVEKDRKKIANISITSILTIFAFKIMIFNY